jgi:HEAT repeat protein
MQAAAAVFCLVAASAWGLQTGVEQQLQDPDARVRERAVKEIGEQGNPAYVSVIAPLVQDSEERVRTTVVRSLIRLGSPASLAPLSLAVRDGIPEIRYLAIDGIVNFYLPGYVDTGFGGFFRSVSRRVEGMFSDVDTVVADPDINLDPEVLRVFRQSVTGAPDMQTRARVARALGILRVKETIPDLVQAAFSDNTELILESLRALQKIKDLSAGPRIAFLLMYPQKDVQIQAALTLGLLRVEEAIGDLRVTLETSEDNDIRAAALDALAFMPNESTALLFMRHLLDREKKLRIPAALGLGRLKSPEHLPHIEQARQRERDASVRLALDFALVSHGRLEYVNEIVDELESRARRGEARPYLVELARESPVRDALYAHLYSRNAEVRKNICIVLGASGDSNSIVQLDNLLRDRDAEVALEASRAIRILRSRGL